MMFDDQWLFVDGGCEYECLAAEMLQAPRSRNVFVIPVTLVHHTKAIAEERKPLFHEGHEKETQYTSYL